MSRRKQEEDPVHMRRALQLAARGQGRVEPNPMVGCVITRGGRVIGEGHHRRFGGPHAEIEALRRCVSSARGATVYVTLEPCCHHGKTPPCTDALLAAGIGRVVAACEDPNPQVAGRGLATLRKAGVQVDVGLLDHMAAALNAPFFKLVQQQRPWVILKWAQSLDGKIATHTGDSKWISDEVCRAHAHRVRGRLDAIIAGVKTVLRDDPLLTSRVGRPRRVATRVILDSDLRTPPRAQLVRTAGQVPTWIFSSRRAAARRAKALERAGCRVLPVAHVRAGLDLAEVLNVLGEHLMTNVLVEGGGQLLGSFFDQHLADELHVYVAPLLIGGRNAPGPLHQLGPALVANARRLTSELRLRKLGTGYFTSVLLTDTASTY